MLIRFIGTKETYPLRLLVLRPGGQLEDCVWANDRLEGGFHLGAVANGNLVCVGSFYPEKNVDLPGWKHVRLRGMATHPEHQGKGAGSRLLKFAVEHLRENHADRLWCNARIKAVPFYERAGFAVHGPEFDIPGIGPHLLMHRTI